MGCVGPDTRCCMPCMLCGRACRAPPHPSLSRPVVSCSVPDMWSTTVRRQRQPKSSQKMLLARSHTPDAHPAKHPQPRTCAHQWTPVRWAAGRLCVGRTATSCSSRAAASGATTATGGDSPEWTAQLRAFDQHRQADLLHRVPSSPRKPLRLVGRCLGRARLPMSACKCAASVGHLVVDGPCCQASRSATLLLRRRHLHRQQGVGGQVKCWGTGHTTGGERTYRLQHREPRTTRSKHPFEQVHACSAIPAQHVLPDAQKANNARSCRVSCRLGPALARRAAAAAAAAPPRGTRQAQTARLQPCPRPAARCAWTSG